MKLPSKPVHTTRIHLISLLHTNQPLALALASAAKSTLTARRAR